ncbi:GAF domain-containing protein [Candidatus Riflebacteria bacterium]
MTSDRKKTKTLLISELDELRTRVRELEDAEKERLSTEEALLQSVHREKQYLDLAGVGFIALDEKGRITLINQKCLEILGYTKNELLGYNWFTTCLPKRLQKDVFQVFKKLIKGEIEPVEYYENPVLRKDGTERIIAWHNTVLKNAAGKINGTLASGEDITERRQAEEELRKAHEMLERRVHVRTLELQNEVEERKKAEEELDRLLCELNRGKQLLESISNSQELFILGGEHEGVFESFLNTMVRMTDSEYGFLDAVLKDKDGELYKRSLALSDISWDADSRTLYEKLKKSNFEFRNMNNLASAPAKTEKLIISNNPANDPRAGGLPKGHPPLKAYMGIPLYFGGKLVGVAAVANRPGGYTKEIARFLEPFTSTCASVIHALHRERGEKQFLDTIKNSEERLRAFLNAVPDISFIFTKDGTYLDIMTTPQTENLLYKTISEVKSRKLHDVLPAESADLFLATIKKTIAENRSQKLEYNLDVPAGKTWFEGRTATLILADGEPAVVWISTDISERKKVEMALDSLRRRLEALWKISQMGDESYDSICNFVLSESVKLTESKYGFYGFMSEDEKIMTLFSWSKDAMADCRVQEKQIKYPIEKSGIWGNAVRERKPFLINNYKEDCPNKTGLPEGHVALNRVMSIPVIISGRVVAIGAVANKQSDYTEEDVSNLQTFLVNAQIIFDRKRADETFNTLVENTISYIGQEYFEQLVRNLADLFNCDFALVGAITAKSEVQTIAILRDGEIIPNISYKLSGAPCGKVLKKGFIVYKEGVQEMFPHDTSLVRMEAEGYVGISLSNNKSEPIGVLCGISRKKIWLPDNAEKIMKVLSTKASAELERQRAVAELLRHHDDLEELVKERTWELKKAHRQLMHAEKLGAIGRFSASIAHEFNNPLFAVMSVINGIKRRTSLVDEDLALVESAINECHRMKDLIKDLQDFNRPTSGKFASTNIHEIIESILLLGKKDLQIRNISVEKDLASEMPQIKAVPDQIKQVILNLLQNAIDACEGKGIIKIRTEVIKDSICMYMQDNGVGINNRHLDRIIEPFFTTKSEVKGIGLGLSISYGIITSHGGTIEVESEPNQGSIIKVTLPIKGVTDEKNPIS